MTAVARIASAAQSIKAKRGMADQKRRTAFGSAVASRRIAIGFKQEDLANLMDVSVQQLSNVEAGRNWPSIPAYQKLCQALRVGVPPLMKGAV